VLTLGFVIETLRSPTEKSANGSRLGPLAGPEVRDGVVDSRQATPGSLFVARPGSGADGHAFVADAFARGAIAALVEKDVLGGWPVIDVRTPGPQGRSEEIPTPVVIRAEDSLAALQLVAGRWRDRLNLRVIGVTGSVGKTTTKELTAEVLERRFPTFRNPGNQNTEVGLPLSMLKLEERHQRAVLEMGFYAPGEIAELCRIARPQVGVITNVSQVHLERAGSLEAIIAGKAELVESLPPAPEGVAILNDDEPHVRAMAGRTAARVISYGLTEQADLWASEVEGLGLDGVRFVMHYQGELIHLRVPLLGRHSVHTALRAAAVGLAEGLTWQEIAGGLQNPQAQLRLVAAWGPQGALLLDDTYNAAPESVIAALNLLSELEGHKIAVLGDMLELGEFEERGHRLVGARAAEVADELVTLGDRGRWIADEAIRAGMAGESVTMLPDTQAAVEHLRGRIRAADVVLVKGSRGMHMDQIVSALERSE
jgi:UDP-N-acetylmuramoyl-tripeptide--D-alanyl-D-alanine ligase